MIFGVALEVVSQLRDTAREKGNLHICAAGVVFMELKLPHVHRVTTVCHNRTCTLGEERALAREVFSFARPRQFKGFVMILRSPIGAPFC